MKNRAIEHIWIWMVLLFMYLPILILVFYSFTDAKIIGTHGSFSLQNYITLFTKDELREMMVGTVILALAVAALSTVLGTVGALGSFYGGKRVGKYVGLLNQIPVVNADVVTGFSVCILFMALLNVDKSTFIPIVVGQSVLCTPFVYLSVLPRLKQMNTSLYEVALDLGAKPAQAITKIVIPQVMPGIVSGFMMAITLSLDDYYIATYTKPATFNTISTYVFNATRGDQTSIKTALWALSAVIFVIVVVIVALSNRKKEGEDEN